MPTYRYTIKKGSEMVIFSEQGIRRISETEVESDHELNSPLLTLVKSGEQMTAEKPVPSTAGPSQQVKPPAPATPPAPQPAPAQPDKPESEKQT